MPFASRPSATPIPERGFVFAHIEIARLYPRVGEGIEPARGEPQLRESVRHAPPSGIAGDASRGANLAVTYLDAFAPAVIAALHPTDWPAVVVVPVSVGLEALAGVRRPEGRIIGDQRRDPRGERVELRTPRCACIRRRLPQPTSWSTVLRLIPSLRAIAAGQPFAIESQWTSAQPSN